MILITSSSTSSSSSKPSVVVVTGGGAGDEEDGEEEEEEKEEEVEEDDGLFRIILLSLTTNRMKGEVLSAMALLLWATPTTISWTLTFESGSSIMLATRRRRARASRSALRQ